MLTLLFFISVPCDSFAAPRKESRKERRERKKKRKNNNVPSPVKKKVTPTLEEKLSPAQVTKKIQTIRKRVETASEDSIPAKYKPILLEVFDDMAKTQMGRYIFEKAHPDLNFRIIPGKAGLNGSYSYNKRCVNLAVSIFQKISDVKTPEEKLGKKLYLAHVIAHESTHSIQHVNPKPPHSNISFNERVILHKLSELHSILNETIVRYQVGNLPEYRHMLSNSPEYRSQKETEPGKVSLVPMHLFFRELKEAKMATGADEKTAERFARTKFVETFWQNNGKTPIQVGNRTVKPTTSHIDEVSRNWNLSYTSDGFERLPHNRYNYHQATTDAGIDKNIQHFTRSMGIETPVSFFRNPKTTSFRMPTPQKIIGYIDGIKNYEMDQLRTCRVSKIFDNGRAFFIIVCTTNTKDAQKDGDRIEYHKGTNVRKAMYSYKNGKMNGIYREYNTQGVKTMEMPVVNDIPTGEGWILENGVRSRKSFSNRFVSNSRNRE